MHIWLNLPNTPSLSCDKKKILQYTSLCYTQHESCVAEEMTLPLPGRKILLSVARTS